MHIVYKINYFVYCAMINIVNFSLRFYSSHIHAEELTADLSTPCFCLVCFWNVEDRQEQTTHHCHYQHININNSFTLIIHYLF